MPRSSLLEVSTALVLASIAVVIAAVATPVLAADVTPQHIHLALGKDSSDLIVMWATKDDVSSPGVLYGPSNSTLTRWVPASSKDYTFLDLYHSPKIHTAAIPSVLPSQRLFYRCTDNATGTASDVFTTVLPPSSKDSSSMKLALIADHGHTSHSKETVSRLLASHAAQPFSALLLAGDLSYADGIQNTWDDYMNIIQPFAAEVPFMVIDGNHEMVVVKVLGKDVILPNLIAYEERFTMPLPPAAKAANTVGNPKLDDSLWWSSDIGPVHVIALNSELVDQFLPGSPMVDWLAADLAAADANRDATPWIVAMWHRPWYSTCHTHGNDTTMRDALEGMFLEHKVNFVLNGHVHALEFSRPLGANGTAVPPGSSDHGITYVTCGNAGNGEGLYDHWVEPQPEMSAYREGNAYGHCEMHVNATHMHVQAFANSNGTLLHETYITQQ